MKLLCRLLGGFIIIDLGGAVMHLLRGISRCERALAGIEYRAEYHPLIRESDLGLGGVDVDIHKRRVKLDIEHTGGKFADHNGILIPLAQSRAARGGLDKSVVYKEKLHIAVRP